MNQRFVWMVAWPDFRTRLRRFLVIAVGMAIVLAVTLLLSAFSEGFNLRGERLLGVFDGDVYLAVEGSAGPMTSTAPFPAAVADEVLAQPGVTEAVPLFLVPNAVLVEDDQPSSAVVVGTPDGVGWPVIVEGRAIEGDDEIVVDLELVGVETGQQLSVAGRVFTIVGRTEHATWDISTQGVFMREAVARDLFASGRPVATAIAVTGTLDTVPAGLVVHPRDEAVADVVSRTAAAKRSIDSFRITLWALAVVIVGSVLYLAALERVRDFAIFKATGATQIDLVLGLALQAALVGVVSGLVSIGLAHLMKPIYPGLLSLPVSVAWTVIPVAVVIAVISSLVGVRRAIKVDPSQAFG